SFFDDAAHGLGPLLPHEIVGIGALGQESKDQTAPRLKVRKCRIDGSVGGTASGCITVEAQDRLRSHAPHQAELVLGERCAEWRYGVRPSGFTQCYNVHVAFDHDELAALVGGRASLMGVEEDISLVE